jgi:hypothetical protein
MAHTHKKSTHHAPGTVQRTAAKGHHHRKSKQVTVAGRLKHVKPIPGQRSIGQALSHVKKNKHPSTATGAPLTFRHHKNPYTVKPPHWGKPHKASRHKAPTAPEEGLGGAAGAIAGSGHTHKKGSGATHTTHKTHPSQKHAHTATSGHDSRNFTPAGPHALLPEPLATPFHHHKP